MGEGKKGFTNVELEAKVFKYSLFLNTPAYGGYFITAQDLLDDNTEKGIRDDFRNTIMKMPSRQLSDTEYADILKKYTLYGTPPGYRKYTDGTFTNFHFYYYLLNNGQQ